MKYLGNYSHWIDPLWEHKILTIRGQARPKDWPPLNSAEQEEYKTYTDAGYDLNATNWWVYEEKDMNISINPPWTNRPIHWWFVKMTPGQFMPVHRDPHAVDKPCERYWMPLQDYQPGHIFLYEDKIISNYLAGDVFMFDNPTAMHGSANIGHCDRISLLITEYL